MRLIAAHSGKLLTLNPGGLMPVEKSFSSGLPEWDALGPGGAFARGAIHELLTEPDDGKAMFAAMVLAMGRGDKRPTSLPSSSQSIIWIDPARELYPPAPAAQGFPLDRLLLLHPQNDDPKGTDLIWAIAECLRCKGVGAVVASPPRLSRIQARRLQLSAEQGGGVGLLLRHVGRNSACHAAATRWSIRPAPGGRNFQRWTIELLHGHGGQIGKTLVLEHCRETNHLHTFDPMADRSPTAKQIAS